MESGYSSSAALQCCCDGIDCIDLCRDSRHMYQQQQQAHSLWATKEKEEKDATSNSSTTHVDDLASELLEYILRQLDMPDLRTAEAVCRRWRVAVMHGRIWKSHAQQTWRAQSAQQLLRYHPPTPAYWKHLYHFRSQLHNLHAGTMGSIITQSVRASSIDFPNQSIENTLSPSPETYWSSAGSSDPNSIETLTYRLGPGMVCVNSISLAAHRAHWQPDHPLYAPKRIRFIFGVAPEMPHDSFEAEFRPNSHMQKFQLPRPVLATWCTIVLIGRFGMQPYDSLYYTVISRVQGDGWPLDSLDDSPIALALKSLASVVTEEAANNAYHDYEATR